MIWAKWETMSPQQEQFLKFHGLQSPILTLGLAMLLVLIAIGIPQQVSKSSASAEMLGAKAGTISIKLAVPSKIR
jgi:uncharacterized membrane protein